MRRSDDEPNLEDAIAKGFSELKQLDENQPIEKIDKPKEEETPEMPAFRGKRDVQEARQEFVIEGEKETRPQPQVEVKEKPDNNLGEDFDVAW